MLQVTAGAQRYRGAMIGALVAAISLPATGVSASKRIRQPSLEELATTWVGGDVESLEYLRLELNSSGKGLLTIQYLPGAPARAYEVIATSLDGYAIALKLKPVDDQQAIEMRGEAIPGLLRLEVTCRSPKWSRRAILQPYEKLLSRIAAVAKRAEAHAGGAR